MTVGVLLFYEDEDRLLMILPLTSAECVSGVTNGHFTRKAEVSQNIVERSTARVVIWALCKDCKLCWGQAFSTSELGCNPIGSSERCCEIRSDEIPVVYGSG
jgi:hypothetical protein